MIEDRLRLIDAMVSLLPMSHSLTGWTFKHTYDFVMSMSLSASSLIRCDTNASGGVWEFVNVVDAGVACQVKHKRT